MRSVTVVLCLFLAPGVGHAASVGGEFNVDGPGAQNCSLFVEAVDQADAASLTAFSAWTEGFVTGVNVFRDETYDVTPWQTPQLILSKMAAFCRENPDVPYVNGLGRLISVLMPNRQTEPSPIIQVRYDGQAVALPTWVLNEARRALEAVTDGGALPTAPDGFDDAFAERLKSFQAAEGLPRTGLPDQATLNRLFP
ncbi:hypothetical protein DKT77_06580 [Meridianimarinicoccus roseus]|uniref:Peptidoglycan binding-like domain-containing protein n=1 Tax=Meridianimarinicoccus roseus TaxID=2072018 RepID=A0A2V2LJX8_9RHOB|nr:hypothetical protein DKT77_06580 [Meridianimarinicoccus roseus]